MKIGLWNIDHPEYDKSKARRHKRFDDVLNGLQQRDCEVLIITEANAAMQLDGYYSTFSDESPFLKKSRNYEKPNSYRQIGVYSKDPIQQVQIPEPINGVLYRTLWQGQPLAIYGNVMTIKDQWKADSHSTYSGRVDEQIEIMSRLVKERCLVGGDFNLKLGWAAKKKAYNRVADFVNTSGLVWPTKERTDTVQHVIHSANFKVIISVDSSVQHSKGKRNSLSDHPFVLIEAF